VWNKGIVRLGLGTDIPDRHIREHNLAGVGFKFEELYGSDEFKQSCTLEQHSSTELSCSFYIRHTLYLCPTRVLLESLFITILAPIEYYATRRDGGRLGLVSSFQSLSPSPSPSRAKIK